MISLSIINTHPEYLDDSLSLWCMIFYRSKRTVKRHLGYVGYLKDTF